MYHLLHTLLAPSLPLPRAWDGVVGEKEEGRKEKENE